MKEALLDFATSFIARILIGFSYAIGVLIAIKIYSWIF